MTFRFVPARIGLGWSIILFAVPGIMLWLATAYLLPGWVARGWDPLAAWFAAGGGLFSLLLLAALASAWWASMRAPSSIAEQLRLRPMSKRDWGISALVLGAAFVLTAGLYVLHANLWPQLSMTPPFMSVTALEPARYYLLGLWVPFFALNIVGEELWWRGFIQPRQEAVFGRGTWILQGTLHAAFHLSFGWNLLLLLLPVVFCIPWAVQRTRNTMVGVVVHAGINGPAFLAVNLGLLSPVV